jgi:hypothetical protein
MFGKEHRLSPLESQKQLLIAESELNRAQLSGEWQTMVQGACDLAHWAQGIAAWASAAALLVAGLRAWRSCPATPGTAKQSWFQKLLNGARLAAAIWGVWSTRGQRKEPR